MKTLLISCTLLLISGPRVQAASSGSSKIVAGDAMPNGWFGISVALDGDSALIGANPYSWNDGTFAPGAAYVFRNSDSGLWEQTARLVASDGGYGDRFGNSVGLSGNRAIVAAENDSDNGDVAGSAYIFEETSPNKWAEKTKLISPNPVAGEIFGSSVSIDGTTAIIGAFGARESIVEVGGKAYVFELGEQGNWNEVAKLKASDAEVADGFGVSVSISGNRAIVGAYLDDNVAHEAGSAYIFERDSVGNWTQIAKLVASDASALNWFGGSVDIFGDTAIVGSHSYGDRSGSAYIFQDDGTGNWSERAKLISSDGTTGVGFGVSVAISQNLALVGANSDDAGPLSGSAFVFRRDNLGSWHEVAKLTADDAAAGDYFGQAVTIDNNKALIGAWIDDNIGGEDAGSAYVYNVPETSSRVLLVLAATLCQSKRWRSNSRH